ncbi:MAG: prepilin peptidase [Coriobacteriia bacterium]|nr:prepilin peptidase [Coriobacteriia bacterium]
MPLWFLVMSFALFGLLFGSFANVVVWRLPAARSIVSPGSHCPSCGKAIAWFDNIPVVSWLLLRARCRACGEPISVRYPLVEIASGVLFALAAVRFGATWQALLAAVVFWLLLVLSAIDIDHYRLPNVLVAILAGIGVIGVAIAQVARIPLAPLTLTGPASVMQPALAALIGLLLGGGLPATIAFLYGAVRRRQGLGMGDIKLLAALGIVLGPYVVMTLVIGSIIGLVVGLTASRSVALSERRIPFGPSLAAGAVITALAGPEILQWYLRLAGLS